MDTSFLFYSLVVHEHERKISIWQPYFVKLIFENLDKLNELWNWCALAHFFQKKEVNRIDQLNYLLFTVSMGVSGRCLETRATFYIIFLLWIPRKHFNIVIYMLSKNISLWKFLLLLRHHIYSRLHLHINSYLEIKSILHFQIYILHILITKQ